MQTVLLKPRNQEELNFVTEFVKKNKMKATFLEATKAKKKKAFLDSLEKRVEEVKQHMLGEIKLNTLEQFLGGI